MKANEFVKKFGIGKAVGILHEWNMFTQIEKPTHFDTDLDIFIHDNDFKFMDESDVSVVELKRLVSSYELVEQLGGLSEANNRLLHLGIIEDFEKIDELMKAIADVESCQ